MDKQELISKLESFRQSCLQQGYIKGDFYLDEAYPGDISTSYVVKMIVNKAWRDTVSSPGKALHRLLEVLFETTDATTRKKVYTLSIYDEDERELMKRPSCRAV
jgi:hypothetical protein